MSVEITKFVTHEGKGTYPGKAELNISPKWSTNLPTRQKATFIF